MHYYEKFRNENFRNKRKMPIFAKKFVMRNPFKFGTIVEDEFFTDRISELSYIEQKLDS